MLKFEAEMWCGGKLHDVKMHPKRKQRMDWLLSVIIFLVHSQVTIIFVVSVCLFVCAELFSAVFDPISIKLRHMLYVWL